MCVSLGTTLSAEHILFSQKVGGEATWRNTYVDVAVARDHIWRGGIFFDAQGGSSRPATPAVPGTPEVQWSSGTIKRTYSIGITEQAISEQIYSKSSASATFYDKLTVNTYNNTNTYSSYGVPDGDIDFQENVDITDPNASASDAAYANPGEAVVSFTTTTGTNYAPAVAGTPAKPARDRDFHPAYLLVKVPSDADIPTFVEAFMNQKKD